MNTQMYTTITINDKEYKLKIAPRNLAIMKDVIKHDSIKDFLKLTMFASETDDIFEIFNTDLYVSISDILTVAIMYNHAIKFEKAQELIEDYFDTNTNGYFEAIKICTEILKVSCFFKMGAQIAPENER